MTTAERLPDLPTKRENPFDPPAELRSFAPVNPLRFYSGAAGWIVTGHQEARALLADPRFSSERTNAESLLRPISEEARKRGTPPGMFISMDAPDHTAYRRELTGQFTVRRMRALQPRIEHIVSEHLDTLEACARPADLVSNFALPVPSMVICELLGVAYEKRAEFQDTTKTLLSLNATMEQVMRASQQAREFMTGLVEEKRADPQEDLISGLITDTELNDEELGSIGFLLLIAGHETTANMLGLGTFALLQHPEQMRKLREQPDLMPGAVEEMLRYLSIINVAVSRVAKEDVDIGGVTIRKGDTVAVSMPAANRDAALVDDPDTLDITRPRSHHVAFGHGIHQCLGQQLAREEMQIGFRQLLERFPNLELAVAPEEVPMRSDMAIYGVHSLPVTW